VLEGAEGAEGAVEVVEVVLEVVEGIKGVVARSQLRSDIRGSYGVVSEVKGLSNRV
jgi:hypothetical protein